jgi:tRNA(adenine34) deaminase
MENTMHDEDHFWMKMALGEAGKAASMDEVPVGACIVQDGRVIGKGHNLTERLNDPTAHAEIIAIGAACTTLASRYLVGTVMYVTLEPCLMCCGAILLSRIQRVVFGARDPKAGAVVSLYQVLSDTRLNHRVDYREGVSAREAGDLLSEFFRKKR